MSYATISRITFGAAILALSVTGCAGEGKAAAVAPTPTLITISASTLAPAAPGKTNSTIYLSDRLRKACGITTVDSVKDTPKFDFDQSAILAEDRMSSPSSPSASRPGCSGVGRCSSSAAPTRAEPRNTTWLWESVARTRSSSTCPDWEFPLLR